MIPQWVVFEPTSAVVLSSEFDCSMNTETPMKFRINAASIGFAFALVILATTMAAAQSPLLLVVNKNENALAFVDVASGKVVGKVATGDGPHEVEASTDGKLAFVSNYGLG